jgi:hypothetical protein
MTSVVLGGTGYTWLCQACRPRAQASFTAHDWQACTGCCSKGVPHIRGDAAMNVPVGSGINSRAWC